MGWFMALSCFEKCFCANVIFFLVGIHSQPEIYQMGVNLEGFQHHQLTESRRCQLRVGEYRVIYSFDVVRNQIELLFAGHRREVYRNS